MVNFIIVDRVVVSDSIKRLLRIVALLLITILVLTGCSRKAMQLGMRRATQGGENIDPNAASTSDRLDTPEAQDHAEGKYLLEILEQQGYYKEIEGGMVCLSFPNFFEKRDVKTLLTYICRNKHIEDFTLDATGLLSCRLHVIIEELFLAFAGTSVHTFTLKSSEDDNLVPFDNIVLSEKFSILKETRIKELVFENVDFGDNLHAMLSALEHTSVHCLCFNLNINISNVHQAFSTLKQTKVKVLKFDGYKDILDLCNILPALEDTSVCSLYVNDINYSELSEDQLHQAFAALKRAKVEALWLGNSGLDNFALSNQLPIIFAALKGTPILKVSLWVDLNPEALDQAFLALEGSNVEVLDLGNMLGESGDLSLQHFKKALLSLDATKVYKVYANGSCWLLETIRLSSTLRRKRWIPKSIYMCHVANKVIKSYKVKRGKRAIKRAMIGTKKSQGI